MLPFFVIKADVFAFIQHYHAGPAFVGRLPNQVNMLAVVAVADVAATHAGGPVMQQALIQ